jgi:hypothetical protein
MKKDLMTSKIISRAACLAELTSNPKSFFNCPDLHGGSGSSEGRVRSGDFLDPAGNPQAAATGSVRTFDTWTLCLHTLLIAEKKRQTNTFGAFPTDLQSLL